MSVQCDIEKIKSHREDTIDSSREMAMIESCEKISMVLIRLDPKARERVIRAVAILYGVYFE